MSHVEQANDDQAKLYGQRIDGQLEKAWEALAESNSGDMTQWKLWNFETLEFVWGTAKRARHALDTVENLAMPPMTGSAGACLVVIVQNLETTLSICNQCYCM